MTQSYTGRSALLLDHPLQPGYCLLVAVECRIEDSPDPIVALVDAAATWCMLPWDLAKQLGHASRPTADLAACTMDSRLGRIRGYLWPFRTAFVPVEGESLEVAAIWFISEQWPGPAVIGWKGCLERIRFGVDPGTMPDSASFYFGPL